MISNIYEWLTSSSVVGAVALLLIAQILWWGSLEENNIQNPVISTIKTAVKVLSKLCNKSL